MIILGVDPGTLFTGYAVIEGINQRLKLLSCDVIGMKPSMKLPVRLKIIYDNLVNIIDEFIPDEFAIETAFYGKNIQSTLKLGHARGVSILAAVNKQIPTTEYSPREIKKSIVGSGAASKEQVQFMVCKMFGIKELPKKLDVSDAIAVAVCHHYNFINKGLTNTKSSWKDYVVRNPTKVKVR